MKKRKKTVPKDETKREKFKRIVEPRVRKVIKGIRLIGNCSGTAYEYTTTDIVNIQTAIQVELDSLDTRFKGKGTTEITFDLD